MADSEPLDSTKETIKLVATVVGAVLVFVAFSDWAQYGNLKGCPMNHLRTLTQALEAYRNDNHGALPPKGKQEESLADYLIDKSAFKCMKGSKYVWSDRPNDVSKGTHLIAACPKAAHGFLRTFAWGLEIADDQLRIVRVKNSGVRVPVNMKKIKR